MGLQVLNEAENGFSRLFFYSKEHPKMQNSIAGLFVALLELIFGVFMFAVISIGVALSCMAVQHVIFSSVLPFFFPNFMASPYAFAITCSNGMAMVTLESVAVIVSLLYIMAGIFNLEMPQIFTRVGLRKFSISKYTWAFIIYTFIAVVQFAAMQMYFGRLIWSTENYYADGVLDCKRMAQIVVLSPIKEEVLFRAIVFHFIWNRAPKYPKVCIVLTNAVFSSLHLLNTRHSHYSASYITLQIAMAFEIGCFFSIQYMRSGSLFESIVLHILNNLVSSFTPMGIQFELSDPLFYIPIAQTCLVVAVFIVLGWREGNSKPLKKGKQS